MCTVKSVEEVGMWVWTGVCGVLCRNRVLLKLYGMWEHLPELSETLEERGGAKGRQSHSEGRDTNRATQAVWQRRLNGPGKEEKPFLSYSSYERGQRRREESLQIKREEGEQKPNGEGEWRREEKQSDRARQRLIQEGEAYSA